MPLMRESVEMIEGAPLPTRTDRLVSLDIARGITIAFMIMVNNNGAAPYAPFQHSLWNGWTPTDLVFPSFLFLVGTSVVFSFHKRLEIGVSRLSLSGRVVRRAALLFLLGLVVNGFPYFHLGTLRIYGVLQRIAVCYLVTALFYLWDRKPWTKVAIAILLLVGYFLLMSRVRVPGLGVPGRDIPFLDPNRNLAAWLDRSLLPGRLYEVTRDPEGVLSTLPAIATCVLGLLAGMWLRTRRTGRQICAGLLGAGMVLIVLGKLWDPWFPINKKLWTSSYVLFAGGCTLLLLAACYWLADVKRWRTGWTLPCIVFGTNAIFAYMLSELLPTILWTIKVAPRLTLSGWIYSHSFADIHPPGFGSLLYSLSFTLLCWLATYALWKQRIFLKI